MKKASTVVRRGRRQLHRHPRRRHRDRRGRWSYRRGRRRGGGGGNGGFWSRLLSRVAIAKEDESQPDWDSYGVCGEYRGPIEQAERFQEVQADAEIISFALHRRRANVGRDDSIYTKAQLQKELETLATCGMFDKVDLEGRRFRTGRSSSLGLPPGKDALVFQRKSPPAPFATGSPSSPRPTHSQGPRSAYPSPAAPSSSPVSATTTGLTVYLTAVTADYTVEGFLNFLN